MSETPPSGAPDGGGFQLPRWVPATIGVVLVLMAALAVYTGVRYRGGPLGAAFGGGGTARAADAGVPGEPEAGGSRIVEGLVPMANEPEPRGASSVVIRGGEEGVMPSIRLSARRAMRLEVVPGDAMVWVNDHPIGSADQFKAPDVYEFPEEGEYSVRLVAPGYDEVEYVIHADPEAPTEVAVVETRLMRSR